MKTLLVGVAIAALVLVNTHAPDIAVAGQFKPVIQMPRIIVRPPNVTPQTKRLIKKNTVEEVTNPAATPRGSAPEADSPLRRRAQQPLRGQTRATAPIPQPRPQLDYTIKAGELILDPILDFSPGYQGRNAPGLPVDEPFIFAEEPPADPPEEPAAETTVEPAAETTETEGNKQENQKQTD